MVDLHFKCILFAAYFPLFPFYRIFVYDLRIFSLFIRVVVVVVGNGGVGVY